uniref:Uncharacterized protein n=1 Tax=Anguilla anguilla TaxID=7936 RepID=A0A0E9V4E0_ANGAN
MSLHHIQRSFSILKSREISTGGANHNCGMTLERLTMSRPRMVETCV